MKKQLCIYLSWAILALAFGLQIVQPVALTNATASLLFLAPNDVNLGDLPDDNSDILVASSKSLLPGLLKPIKTLPILLTPTPKIPIKIVPTATPKPTMAQLPTKSKPTDTIKPILTKPIKPTPTPTEKLTLITRKPLIPKPTIPFPILTKSTTRNVTDLEITLVLYIGTYSGTYTGMMTDGLPNDEGTFVTMEPDGHEWIYTGSWENGHMVGHGSKSFSYGTMYIGEFLDDRYSGQGELYQDGILIYEGAFIDGHENGMGMRYNINGDLIFAGMFQNGSPQESMEERIVRTAGFKQLCTVISYHDYKDDIDDYIGAKIRLTGTVLNVYEVDAGFELQCDMLMNEQGIEYQIIKILYDLAYDQQPFEENDTITVWGTIDGLFRYTVEDGYRIVPEIQAWIIE